ncbi:MAG: peptide deformylase [Proteobacteria bacterium]|nr:peptide deformylase [Pseudomonadota bacterium]
MAVLKILAVPDQRLRTKALPVEKVDGRIQDLMGDLLDTMKWEDQGIGLAANQIGVLERVLAIDVGPEYQKAPLLMANPEIIFASSDEQHFQEGCLSVPEQYEDVWRPKEVRVRYLDEHNKSQEITATGLLAACVQHEIDHLNGILYVDHLSALRRKLTLARALRAAEALRRK